MIDREEFVGEDVLNAYVDGELSAERRSAVETWLAAHPEDAAKVAAKILPNIVALTPCIVLGFMPMGVREVKP